MARSPLLREMRPSPYPPTSVSLPLYRASPDAHRRVCEAVTGPDPLRCGHDRPISHAAACLAAWGGQAGEPHPSSSAIDGVENKTRQIKKPTLPASERVSAPALTPVATEQISTLQ